MLAHKPSDGIGLGAKVRARAKDFQRFAVVAAHARGGVFDGLSRSELDHELDKVAAEHAHGIWLGFGNETRSDDDVAVLKLGNERVEVFWKVLAVCVELDERQRIWCQLGMRRQGPS